MVVVGVRLPIHPVNHCGRHNRRIHEYQQFLPAVVISVGKEEGRDIGQIGILTPDLKPLDRIRIGLVGVEHKDVQAVMFVRIVRTEKKLLTKRARPPRILNDVRRVIQVRERSRKYPLQKGLDRLGGLPLRCSLP
jgi:hypothetical protein